MGIRLHTLKRVVAIIMPNAKNAFERKTAVDWLWRRRMCSPDKRRFDLLHEQAVCHGVL